MLRFRAEGSAPAVGQQKVSNDSMSCQLAHAIKLGAQPLLLRVRYLCAGGPNVMARATGG